MIVFSSQYPTGTFTKCLWLYFSGSIPSSLAVLRNSSSSGCLGNTCLTNNTYSPIFSPLTTISTEKSISLAWQKYVPRYIHYHTFTQRLLPSFDPLVYFIQKSVKLLPSVIYSPFLHSDCRYTRCLREIIFVSPEAYSYS